VARNLEAERFRAQRLFLHTIALGAVVVAASCASESTVPGHDGSTAVPSELRQLFLFHWSASAGGSPAPHGFLLKRAGAAPLALTAYHVAGDADRGAWLRSPLDPSMAVRLGDRVFIDGAATIGANGSQKDLAAFRPIDWDGRFALELASDLPAVGDTVWVLAVHMSDPANPHPFAGARRHPARVDVSHDAAFVYTYLRSANANYTSGAAVLDRDGRVVAVNVGSRVMNADAWQQYRDRYAPCCHAVGGNEVVGLGVHVHSIKRMIGDPDVPVEQRLPSSRVRRR
jgi:hypothetical protein